MPYYKATIEVLVEVNSEAEACDAIAEAIRPILKMFSPPEAAPSAWVDWRYANGHAIPEPHNGEGFEYAEKEKCDR